MFVRVGMFVRMCGSFVMHTIFYLLAGLVVMLERMPTDKCLTRPTSACSTHCISPLLFDFQLLDAHLVAADYLYLVTAADGARIIKCSDRYIVLAFHAPALARRFN